MAETRAHARPRPGMAGLPPVSPWLLGWFARYTRWYLARHFHALRISVDGWLPDTENAVPKVCYLNHASWWDPLVCLHLCRHLFSRHAAYAPIDGRAIAKYAFFKRLGFFGVEAATPRGAATFLRLSGQILAQPWSMLWVTPQARFADVRERPVRFRHGLGHLAVRVGRHAPELFASPSVDRAQFIPLALEYTYWEERLPEVLLRFGEPLEIRATEARQRDAVEWTRLLEEHLERTMDTLAEEARRRDPARFLTLLAGRAGVGGPYDAWRRAKAALHGQSFDGRHGTL